MRTTLGLRLLPTATRLYLTFEPASFVLLFPLDANDAEGSSRFAMEIGLIKFGWRF